MRGEGIGPIPIQAPTPSILTTAKPRTNDDFGVRVPLPGEVDVPEGALDASTTSWRTGVSWVQTACAESFAQQPCPTADEITLGEMTPGGYGLATSRPFWSFTAIECEWTTTPGDVDTAAEALTEARAAWHLSRGIWLGDGIGDLDVTGDFPQPTLRSSAQIAPGGDVASAPEDAVALLLAAYETGTQGLGGQTLHVPGPLIPNAMGAGDGGIYARQEGNFYRGPNGSVISPGPGYPFGASADGADGFGPLFDDSPVSYVGNDSDEVWFYITGPVEYALSKVVPLPTGMSFMVQNRKLSWAMRQLIFRFDPCSVWAALVQSPVTFVETS